MAAVHQPVPVDHVAHGVPELVSKPINLNPVDYKVDHIRRASVLAVEASTKIATEELQDTLKPMHDAGPNASGSRWKQVLQHKEESLNSKVLAKIAALEEEVANLKKASRKTAWSSAPLEAVSEAEGVALDCVDASISNHTRQGKQTLKEDISASESPELKVEYSDKDDAESTKPSRPKKTKRKKSKRQGSFFDYLEDESQFASSNSDDEFSDVDKPEPKVEVVYNLELRRVKWEEYEKIPTTQEGIKTLHVIDVLEGPAMREVVTKSKDQEGKAVTVHAEITLGENSDDDGLNCGRSDNNCLPLPDRIRVNSGPLLDLLCDEIGYLGSWNSHMTFLSPYKAFLRNESKLRQKLVLLNKEVENYQEDETTPGKSADTNESAKSAEQDQRPMKEDIIEGEEINDETKSRANKELTGKQLVEQKRDHLTCLINLFDHDLKEHIAKYRSVTLGEATHITFRETWMLYDLGDDVYSQLHNGTNQVLKIIGIYGGYELKPPKYSSQVDERTSETIVHDETSTDRLSPLIIDCFHYDYDGKSFGPRSITFTIRAYAGHRAITGFPVYPVKYVTGFEDVRKDFIARGERFLDFCKLKHMSYNGLTIDDPPERVESQVMIDLELAYLEFSDWCPKLTMAQSPIHPREVGPNLAMSNCDIPGCSLCGETIGVFNERRFYYRRCENCFQEHTDSLAFYHSKDDVPAEIKLYLPGRIYAFVLRTRKWVTLEVNKVQPVVFQRDGMKSLVLPKGHKKVVRALVEMHARGAKDLKAMDDQIDLISGKGKGLIVLLHGVPGVGKTSTAECIADHTEKPLFQITCGDIGLEPEDVEERLGMHFRLAHKWGCVLLLDEADVFLQKRDKSDLKRNALVSVFLRILEYYSGILFLTTNRVGIFDEAFKSRIHMSLYYPALEQKAYLRVWKVNISRTKAIRKNIFVEDEEIMEFADKTYNDLRWNGRQIRNAFQTAIALAEYRSNTENLEAVVEGKQANPHVSLRRDEFETVAQASKGFDKYLKKVLGGNDPSWQAEKEGYRYDKYGREHRKANEKRAIRERGETEASSCSEVEFSESSGSEGSGDSHDEHDDKRKKKTGRKAKRRPSNKHEQTDEDTDEAPKKSKKSRKTKKQESSSSESEAGRQKPKNRRK